MRCPPGTAPGSMSRPGLAQAAYRTMVGPQGPHRGYSRSHGRPACHRPHYRPHAVMVSTPLRDAVWSWRASSSLSVAVSCHALGCPTVSGPWDNLKHRAACRHDGIGTHGGGAIVQHATCAWPQVRGVPYFFQNTSTRPVVSTVVCRPVQNGWQLEHTVTRMLGTVERVCTVAPQVHVISVSS